MPVKLTGREQDCLYWAALGKTSWEMGCILGITERTANFHITNACQKLEVRSRQAAIVRALQLGLLDLDTVRHGESCRPARKARQDAAMATMA